jgi:hypothetical protein
MESLDSNLDGNYNQRPGAILNCAQTAFKRGFDVFALENGGKCFSGPTADKLYTNYDVSLECSESGKGGDNEKDIYRIKRENISKCLC